MRIWFQALLISIFFSGQALAQDNSMAGRQFIMSCTYGVLAGTLVGGAMLAFEDAPGDNLNKVARGASLGLYAGILLGLYVVYGISDGQEEYEEYLEERLPEGIENLPPEVRYRRRPAPSFRMGLAPYVDPNGVSGATAQLQWSVF